MTAPPRGQSALRVAFCVFLPFAAGFYMSYLFRSVNAIIAPQLIADIGLSAGTVGLLTATYFFGIAACQPLLGIVLDRFGPRRAHTGLFMIGAAGSLVFALGDDAVALMVGRCLIGVGMAGGLMTGFKAIVLWFDERRWPLMNGLFMTLGGLGAITATTPVEAFLHYGSWRDLFVVLSVVTVLSALLVFVLVPERGTAAQRETLRDVFRGLRIIFSDPLFWRIAPLCATTIGFGVAFQGLWAGPWLKDVIGLTRAGVADHLLILAVALLPGFLLVGIVGDWAGRHGIPLSRICGYVTVPYLLTQIPLLLDPESGGAFGLYAALIGIALFSNANILGHPMHSAHFTEKYSGRATTALNLFIFTGAFVSQYAVGALIDLWTPTAPGAYPVEAYRVTFAVALGLQLLAWLWFVAPSRKR